MANSIELDKVIVPASAGLETSFWLKEMGHTDYSSKYTNESGEQILVKVHNSANFHQTNDITGLESSMETKTVPLDVNPYMGCFEYTDIEDTFELTDKSIFLENAGSALADDLTNFAYNKVCGEANTGIVISSGTADFKVLSDALININGSKQMGKNNGILSSELRGLILDSSKTNQAFSYNKLADQYIAGNISNWNGAKWADYSIEQVQIEDIFPAGTFTITNTAGVYGGTVAQYTPTASIGTAVSIKKGTKFTLSGVLAVNRRQQTRVGTKRMFTVQADVTIPTGTGGAVINIGEVFFTGALKNVSVSAISAVALNNEVAADTNYYTGLVYKDTELLMAAPDLIVPKGAASASTKSVDGYIPMRITYDYASKKSLESLVMKTMFGARLYTGNAAYSIYVKA